MELFEARLMKVPSVVADVIWINEERAEVMFPMVMAPGSVIVAPKGSSRGVVVPLGKVSPGAPDNNPVLVYQPTGRMEKIGGGVIFEYGCVGLRLTPGDFDGGSRVEP